MDMNFDDLEDFTLDDMLAPVEEPVVEPTPEEMVNESFETVKITLSSGLVREIKPEESAYPPACDVRDAQAELDEINALLAPINERKREVDEKIKALKTEYEKAMDALSRERYAIQEESFDLNRKQRDAARKVKEALLVLERALEAQRLSELYLEKSSQFDDMIVNMPWKDKAFPHQIEGAKRIAMAGSAILGDKMGLGKSLTSLIAADMLQVKRLLIIVPDDVVTNFMNEVQHWAPHRNVVMLGKLPKVQRALAVEFLKPLNEYTVVLNYSAWRRDSSLLDKLINLRFEMVILDEAHIIKETSTNAYRGCKQVIMAANACPECYGPITSKRHREPIFNDEGRRLYTSQEDFWHCTVTNCGWSEIKDRQKNITRDFGALRSVRHVVPMTGTVILNKPTDIFALLSLIQPEVYTNKNEFVRTFCQVGYDGKVQFRPGGMDSLAKKLAGRYIARDRNSAGVVLPKQEIVFHDIEMDAELYPKQAKVIQQLTKHAMIMLENGKQLPILAMIALITRKRQANVWPAGIELKDEDGVVVFSVGDDVQESIKLDKIITSDGEDGLLPELTADGNMELGERVVVFSQFKGPLAELERRCKKNGISVVRFDGDTPQDIRVQVKKDFDRKFCDVEGYEKKWQVVLCNYKTGGVGLNFTSATQMIVLDREWNPGKQEQAYGRIDRMGQTEETTVHILNLEKTVDTWMDALNNEKQEMINGFETSTELAGMLYEAMKNGDA